MLGRVTRNTVNTKDTAIMIGRSKPRNLSATGIGLITAVTPRMPNMLKMLEPTILPMAISD